MNLRRIWQRVGILSWRLVVLLLGFAIMLVVVLPFIRPLLGITCDAQEKAALLEFPQYGGNVLGKDIKRPLGGEVVNFPPLQAPPPGCTLEGFAAPQASPKQVSAFYEKKLTEHGWTVKRFPVDRQGEFEYAHVQGGRNGLGR